VNNNDRECPASIAVPLRHVIFDMSDGPVRMMITVRTHRLKCVSDNRHEDKSFITGDFMISGARSEKCQPGRTIFKDSSTAVESIDVIFDMELKWGCAC
jgi:hypothetical protein